jgi:ABC-type polysaccharide/polyol phosphate transport system ATPase subunit
MTFAIEVNHVSKGFKIHHEKKDSVYSIISGIIKKNLSYEYLNVLKDISFSVQKGETFGIIGGNGQGKTTLLKLISNIYRPEKGEIKISGKIVPLLQLGIGFHPELTPIDNIITYGILLGFKKDKIKSLIPKILEYAELQKFSDVKIKNFSSGMYTRLAFATAVMVKPDILIIDEVLAVGDISFKTKCFQSIEELTKQNKTVILVSHDLNTLTRLCDRVMILQNGKIEKIGEPKSVIQHYIQSKLPSTESKIKNKFVDDPNFISSPQNNLKSANHFNLLTSLGLREHHLFLDIGCGSLELGKFLIPYLLNQHYFGYEPRVKLLQKGLLKHFRNSTDVKHPYFYDNQNFKFNTLKIKFDFIFDQNVFSYAPKRIIRKYLSEIKKVMKPTTILVVNIFQGNDDYENDKWAYPSHASYSLDFIHRLAKEFDLFCKVLTWKTPDGRTCLILIDPKYRDKIPNI